MIPKVNALETVAVDFLKWIVGPGLFPLASLAPVRSGQVTRHFVKVR